HDVLVRTSAGKAELRLDLEALSLEIDASEKVPDHLTLSYYSPNDKPVPESAELKAEDISYLGLSLQVEKQLQEISRDVSERLVRETMTARRELNEALKELYRQALGEKAASMGSVKSVAESSDGSSWRVRGEIA
ncbi:MAG: hypothetical protein HQM09_06545, partial [Candidatus Riflebacteria bacterium]|nr:hypothetical protein [Candidatus Riflebacteria bacterium]